jgi:hypothetical protein
MALKGKLLFEEAESKSFPIKLGVDAHELLKKHEADLRKFAKEMGENKPKRHEVLNYMFKKAAKINNNTINADDFIQREETNKITLSFGTTFYMNNANRLYLGKCYETVELYAIEHNKKLPRVIAIYNFLLEQVTEIDPADYFKV